MYLSHFGRAAHRFDNRIHCLESHETRLPLLRIAAPSTATTSPRVTFSHLYGTPSPWIVRLSPSILTIRCSNIRPRYLKTTTCPHLSGSLTGYTTAWSRRLNNSGLILQPRTINVTTSPFWSLPSSSANISSLSSLPIFWSLEFSLSIWRQR